MSADNRVTYPVSNAQQTVLYQIIYSPNKRLMQIPMYITINQALDIDLLKKAIEIEYERNDALRLRFYQEEDKTRQYFLDKVDTNIRFMDFSGKTKEQQDSEIEKDSLEVQDWLGGDVARFIIFKSFDGGTGLYVHLSHLLMDASALVLLFKDIFAVYFALRDGTDMPKPLDKFEETLKKDLEYNNKPEQMQKDGAFFAGTYQEHGEPAYAGVCGQGQLKKQRVLFRDRKQKYIVPTYALSEKIGTETMQIKAAEAKKITDFCEANHINFNAFLQLAIRSYCSKVNNNQEDIVYNTICSRRPTRVDKNSSGCRMNTFLLYSHIEGSMTAAEAIESVSGLNMSAMRHCNYSILYALGSLYKMYNTQKKGTYTSFMLTYLPFQIDLPECWKLDYKWYDPGNAMPIYIFVIPDLNGDGIMFNYEYRKVHIKKKHLENLHSYIVKFFNAVVENPNVTMNELLAINP